nr:hypothetical protein [Treponema sp.]
MAEKKSFKDKLFSFLDRSVESSKNIFHKAGEKINDFSDKSVTRIDIARLNSKLEKLYEDLGKLTFEKREVAKKSSSDLKEFDSLYSQIENLLQEIESKKLSISEGEEKKSDDMSSVPASSQPTVILEAADLQDDSSSPAKKSASVKSASTKTASVKNASSRAASTKTASVKSGSAKTVSAKASAKSSAPKKTSAEKAKTVKTSAAKKTSSVKKTAAASSSPSASKKSATVSSSKKASSAKKTSSGSTAARKSSQKKTS